MVGTEPARMTCVGDELDVDARAATAAGLAGVWLARPGQAASPDASAWGMTSSTACASP